MKNRMSYLTLVSPARAMMLLNIVLQTKYEATQEIVPSVPEKKKKSLTTVQRERNRQKSSSSQPTRGYNAQAQIKKSTRYQIYIRGYANLTCKLTTKLDRGFTDWNHLANAIVSSFWNQAHVQCIISVSFILDCGVGKSITNGKSLLTI